MTSITSSKHFLGPTDLAMAKRVFDRICLDRSIDLSSREAKNLAAGLIQELERGVRDEERIVTALGLTVPHRRITADSHRSITPINPH